MMDRATLEFLRAEVRREVKREAGEFDARMSPQLGPLSERQDQHLRQLLELEQHVLDKIEELEKATERSEALSVKAKRYTDQRVAESMPPSTGARSPMPTKDFLVVSEADKFVAHLTKELEESKVEKKKLLDQILETKQQLEANQKALNELEAQAIKNRNAITFKLGMGIVTLILLAAFGWAGYSQLANDVARPPLEDRHDK
jgi:hypothetical protein